MKKVILAETAGFCFGVNRAVEMVQKLLDDGKKVCTLGEIIHNKHLVETLEKRGARVIDCPNQSNNEEVLVIRSHGVPKTVEQEIAERGINVCDATCPFVSKIHKIVETYSNQGFTVLVAGDPNHQEVKGIVGHSNGKCIVFEDETVLINKLNNSQFSPNEPLIIVCQTTFNKEIWSKCQKTLKKVCTNAKIFDTICNATANRQEEAKNLSMSCDAMIVIGDRHSSNSKKLKDVCLKYCENTFFVENCHELKNYSFSDFSQVGVVAGASTPAGIIKEVLKTMSEIIVNEEMSFEEMLEASLSSFNTEQKVKGVVLGVSPTEVQVDIGRKHAGFIPASEFSNDPNLKLTEAVKIGDEIDLIVMKTNDQEGTVMLSKRRFDSIAGWDKVCAAKESEEILEGVVSDVIKGGIVVFYEGIRVFIPASHATLNRNDSLEELKGKTTKFKVIEIGQRRRVIGSIKTILREQRKEAEAKIWETLAVGDRFTGTVKSITGYGAFVDIGGVDGMVHISELSWERIKNPTEVVAVGDVVEVYVKAVDPEKRKISLGYKKADENPWTVLQNNYAIGDTVNVKIVSMTTYGAFAKVIPGVDGLIHISQIADRRIEKPQDELTVGQEVDAKIIEIDFDKKRVSLSIRALLENNSDEVAEDTAVEAE